MAKRIKFASGIRFAYQLNLDREIILSYLDQPSVIKRVFKGGRGQHKRENQRASSMRTWPNVAGFEDGGRGP